MFTGMDASRADLGMDRMFGAGAPRIKPSAPHRISSRT
jgi:hypothetical protein